MKIKIRNGKKGDLQSVLNLIKELAEYENAIDEVTITLKELEKDGFGDLQYYKFLVAEINEKIIGLSFYWFRYSTWKGRFLFLEDFIIKEKYRRSGVGSKLFEATIKICQELKMNGMCWQVLDWNKNAIEFYNKYNAEISNSWLNGKLTNQQIKKFRIS